MEKRGRPRLDGEPIVFKLRKDLVEELNKAWIKTECISRSEFIRRAILKAINDTKSDKGNNI